MTPRLTFRREKKRGFLVMDEITLTDMPFYIGPDSGCQTATLLLGESSRCLDCPLDICVTEMSKTDRAKLAVYIHSRQAGEAD